jgi:hypothetical protein
MAQRMMSIVDEATGTELDIVVDDKTHLKVVLRIRFGWFRRFGIRLGILLGLEDLLQLPGTVSRLEESGGKNEPFQLVVIFLRLRVG